jgi:hypothetical protein
MNIENLLSINEALAGFSAIIVVTNIAAALWLSVNLVKQIRHSRCRRPWFWQIVHKAPMRITAGFIIKSIAIAVIFFLRLPLRSIRDAHNVQLGEQWLEMSLHWESALTLFLSVGMVMIMWPAMTKYASLRVSLIAVVLALVLLYFAGAFFVRYTAPLFAP